MGDSLGKLFVEPADLPHNFGGFIQILFLMVVYGYILFSSSNLISDGSELLLLVPSLAGVVGSVVLPVLGAVPDGAIVLFSGMGPKEEVQDQLAVGVGALAGSTVMLLTLPWFLAILAGRVNVLPNGSCKYSKPKLVPAGKFGLFTTGVEPSSAVARGGKIMLVTMIPYFLIQGPAFVYHCGKKNDDACHPSGEKYWALAGLILCFVSFLLYLWDQMKQSQSQAMKDRIDEVRKSAISNNMLSLRGVFSLAGMEDTPDDETHLLGGGRENKRLRSILRSFFTRYDRDGNGFIDASELRSLLLDLNENPSPEDFNELMTEMDTDKSGHIDFGEFYDAMVKIVLHQGIPAVKGGAAASNTIGTANSSVASAKGSINDKIELEEVHAVGPAEDRPFGLENEADGDDEEEEEEEVPEDLAHLTPEQQQTRIKLRAAWMMGLGTFLVLLFSDPMVGVINEFGNRIHIPPFYVSFVVAPLSSNCSELIAAYSYALKKTKKTITISLSCLLGAGSMNNSFCLGIFLALIYFKSLVWEFSAETISIIFVEVIMGVIAARKVHTLFTAFLVVSLFPISIGLVAALEAIGLN